MAWPHHFHVFSRGRETVFDDDLDLVDTYTRITPVIIDAVVMSPRTSVVEFRGIQEGGPAVLLSLRHGSEEARLGFVVKLPLNTSNSLGSVRVLGQGNAETFWTAFNNRYEFRQWSRSKVSPIQREGLHPTIVYSIVEVIDIDTGVSRGRVRLDGLIVSFPAEGFVAIREADQRG